jgi:DNA-binding FadR family transcriptional regulator
MVLAREGLIVMTPGGGTRVLDLKQWRVELTSGAGGAQAVADLVHGLAYPGRQLRVPETAGDALWLAMTVESANIGGALETARRIAREAGGRLEGARR